MPSPTSHVRRWPLLILSLLAVLTAIGCGDGESEDGSGAISLTVAVGAVGQERMLARAAADRFEAAEAGVKVRLLETPDLASDRLGLYLQYLGAGSEAIDLYQIDVIWPAILAEHAVDLRSLVPAEDVAEHFASIIDNNEVDGKLVALPWFADAGLLYYRTDLLKRHGFPTPPATWDELELMARTVQEAERAAGNPDFWGFVWQGAAYEGLTCNALEWQVSAGAGPIIDPGGGIEVDDARTIAAMDRAASWVGTISPPGVTTYAEEDARAIWQTGNACFMRNWPYAYPLGNAVDPATGERSAIAGRFDVGPLPAGNGGTAAALGGWQLMVSRYSKHPELAARLARFLTSAEEQKVRAIRGAFNPTRPALYDDPEVLAAAPFFDALRDVWNGAVARPSAVCGRRYNQVSTAYFTAVHDILTGAPAAARLGELEQELQRILR